jgi:hypothetical protein
MKAKAGAKREERTYDQIKDELEAVFRKLTAYRPNEESLPSSLSIPGLIRELIFLVDRKKKSAGKRDLERALQRLKEIVDEIASIPANMAVLPADWAFPIRALADPALTVPALPIDKGGAPSLVNARDVAKAAARDFYLITGSPPDIETKGPNDEIGGPFVEFLKDVFTALDITTSATTLAPGARRWLKKEIDTWNGETEAWNKLTEDEKKKAAPPRGITLPK